jgi:tetratricopeptide (TPR) repeat protein
MLCPYFGRWPTWINFFVESCKWNPDVHWRIYTDCGEPENKAGNIDFIPISFDDYKALVRERLKVAFDPVAPYKLCDLKATLGVVHEKEIIGYPFFGYGDIDVVYGDISRFYGEKKLAALDVVSTHPERLSGHFAVLRNTSALRRAFERIPEYRALLETPQLTGMDESGFSEIFLNSTKERSLFVERYSTVLCWRGWHDGTMNYPQRWFWRRGHLTNERDGEREFLYLHFMRWQSPRWINDPPQPGEAMWVGREIVHMDWRLAGSEGFCISPAGFTSIDPSSQPVGRPAHPVIADLERLTGTALLRQEQGESAETRRIFERTLANREKVLGPKHPKTAHSFNNLAELLRRQNNFHAARPLFERAIEIFEETLGTHDPNTNLVRRNLARLLLEIGRPVEALAMAEAAVGSHERELGPNHVWTVDSAQVMADALDALGLGQKAAELRKRYRTDGGNIE